MARLRKPANDLNQPTTAGLGHDRWELEASEIEFGRELGAGNFGVVKEGLYKVRVKRGVQERGSRGGRGQEGGVVKRRV